MPQLQDAVGALELVYVGGPVQTTAVVFLAEFVDLSIAGLLVLGRIGFPAPDADIEQLAQATTRRRVFAGHAGWGPGQLDAEIEGGDWIADTALPDDVFSDDPDELWSQRADAQGRQLCPDRADAGRSEPQLSRSLPLGGPPRLPFPAGPRPRRPSPPTVWSPPC